MAKHNWVICDIDGTLADIRHRLHFLKGEASTENHQPRPDWDRFNAACVNDSLKLDVAEVLRALQHNHNVAIMTGRSAKYRSITQTWLLRKGIEFDMLLMRKEGDYRSDVLVKDELYKTHFDDRRVICVLEDRDRVVEMWRGLGLTCLQVEKGTY